MTQQNKPIERQGLVDLVLSVAKSLLQKYPTFNPFAGVIQQDGSSKLLVEEGAIQGKPGKDPIQTLVDHLKIITRERSFRAVAICTNTRSQDQTLALIVHYEDCAGNACTLHLPYTTSDGNVKWDKLIEESGERLVYEG